MKTNTKWLIALLVVIYAQSAWTQTLSPTEFVRTKTDELLTIVDRPVEPGTDEYRQRQDDLKSAVRGFIDFEELCQRALGRHWGDRSAEEQVAFVELMTRLIETNYTVKLGDRRVGQNYTVEYEDERIRNDVAMISGTVTYRDQETFVEIWMIQRDDTLIVYDIVTDDVSLVETYAESFDEIIATDGWDELVRRLQERVDELEAELQSQGAE